MHPCRSMVLADDVNGDGFMDLVVTTLNGNVYLIETGGRYHPMKSWTAEVWRKNMLSSVSNKKIASCQGCALSRATEFLCLNVTCSDRC